MSRHDMTTKRFASFKELAHFAETHDQIRHYESGCYGSEEWSGGLDLPDTLHKLKSGYIWDEGVSKLKTSLDVTEKLAAKALMPMIKRDVIGGAVSIGAYLAGHPRNMRRREPAPAIDKPVLSVGIPLCIVCSCTAEQRANYGAAMLSVCNVLERKGYRLEIDALWRAGVDDRSPYTHWINMEVAVKTPRNRLNLAAFAFAIMHAAMFRRAGFRVAEAVAEWQPTVGHCYGIVQNGHKFHDSMAADYDLYLDNMDPRVASMCNTPEGAFKYVTERVNQQLKSALEA